MRAVRKLMDTLFSRGCFLILSIVVLTSCEQAKVDAQMEELCKKDGGMQVYQKVAFPSDHFTEYGDIKFFETWNTSKGGYRFKSSHENLKSNKPTLTRRTYSVVRESDSRILGVYVVYSRIGGDIIWRPGPDSSKSCPADANSTIFLRTIFVREN